MGKCEIRSPEELAKEIDTFAFEVSQDGKPIPLARRMIYLENHIQRRWSAREVIFFQDFLHGGYFVAEGNRYKIHFYGYDSKDAEFHQALDRLWHHLTVNIYGYIGAHLFQRISEDYPKPLLMYDTDDFLDFTIDDLMKLLPQNVLRLFENVSGQISVLSAETKQGFKETHESIEKVGEAAEAAATSAKGTEDKFRRFIAGWKTHLRSIDKWIRKRGNQKEPPRRYIGWEKAITLEYESYKVNPAYELLPNGKSRGKGHKRNYATFLNECGDTVVGKGPKSFKIKELVEDPRELRTLVNTVRKREIRRVKRDTISIVT